MQVSARLVNKMRGRLCHGMLMISSWGRFLLSFRPMCLTPAACWLLVQPHSATPGHQGGQVPGSSCTAAVQ